MREFPHFIFWFCEMNKPSHTFNSFHQVRGVPRPPRWKSLKKRCFSFRILEIKFGKRASRSAGVWWSSEWIAKIRNTLYPCRLSMLPMLTPLLPSDTQTDSARAHVIIYQKKPKQTKSRGRRIVKTATPPFLHTMHRRYIVVDFCCCCRRRFDVCVRFYLHFFDYIMRNLL